MRDAQGNPLGRGGDKVEVTIAGVLKLNVEDLHDGTYRAVWIPYFIGLLPVDIVLNGTPLKEQVRHPDPRSFPERFTRRVTSTYPSFARG